MEEMNYFHQRRAFRNLKEREINISEGQNSLYRELLDYANDEHKGFNWFHLKNSALSSWTGLSESGFIKARNQLVQLNLIRYKPGKKNSTTPQYQIIKLYNRQETDSTTDRTATVQQTGQVKELLRQNYDKTKNKHHHDDADAPSKIQSPMVKWQENYMSMNAIQQEQLQKATQHFGKEIVNEAIDRTAVAITDNDRGRAFSYFTGIMRNWKNAGVTSLADINALDEKHDGKKAASASRPRYQSAQKQEIATDWSTKHADMVEVSDTDINKLLKQLKKREQAAK